MTACAKKSPCVDREGKCELMNLCVGQRVWFRQIEKWNSWLKNPHEQWSRGKAKDDESGDRVFWCAWDRV